jgi:DNA-binding CsgD family transcriptional regulator
MKNQTNSVKTPFSTSELRAVELLAQGYTEKEIAEKLCISPHTVNNHLRNVRERNSLRNDKEVVLLYIALEQETLFYGCNKRGGYRSNSYPTKRLRIYKTVFVIR